MKFRLNTIAWLCCVIYTAPATLWAQKLPSSPQQGIEQSMQLMRERLQPKPVVHVDTLGLETTATIRQLQGVQVRGDLLKTEIEKFWKPYSGQAVSAEKIQEFHAWFNEKARRAGFMAYAQTETVEASDGQILIIQSLQPKVGTVRIFSKEPALVERYEELLKKRFDVDFKSGMPLDTLGLDQRLDSVSYDLPIELDATLRAVGPELLDLIVNITPAAHQAAKLVNFAEQWSNYGLKQYGHLQITAMGKITGWREKSSLALMGQISEGLDYGRAEYEDLVPAWGGRWRIYGSHANSKSTYTGAAKTENNSGEVGAGLTRILGGHRDMVFKGQVELSARETRSHLMSTGTPISNVNDHQLRMRLSTDNERLTPMSTRAELGLTLGDYIHVQGPTLPVGTYKRVDALYKTEQALDRAGTVSLLGRIKGQWTDRNLDAYNQMALGGLNAVRAYSSIDGVGDRAVVGTLEVNKSFKRELNVGVFYDGGYVQNSVQRITGQSFNHDTLQSVGLKLEGQVPGLNYSFFWAKGVGGYKSWQNTNLESKPNNNRIWASVTIFVP